MQRRIAGDLEASSVVITTPESLCYGLRVFIRYQIPEVLRTITRPSHSFFFLFFCFRVRKHNQPECRSAFKIYQGLKLKELIGDEGKEKFCEGKKRGEEKPLNTYKEDRVKGKVGEKTMENLIGILFKLPRVSSTVIAAQRTKAKTKLK